MREIQDIVVEQGIVHVVAPRRNKLTLSDDRLPTDEPILDYLTRHVTAGLRDTQASAAIFEVRTSGSPSELCETILASADQLTAASRKLATRLYEIAKKDKRVSDGALVALICNGVQQNAELRFLALLKLDPAAGFRPVTEERAGRKVVRLEREEDMLPSARERLQKAAFVRGAVDEDDYQILAVDRQTATEPARFFVSDFLGAAYFLDDVQRTTRLYRTLKNAQNDVAPDLTAKQLLDVAAVFDGALASTTVNLDDLVESLPVPQKIKKRVDDALVRALPDREFDLDPGLGHRLGKRRQFEGDNGLRVIVPAEFFDKMITVDDVQGTKPVVRRVTIRTRKWEEK